MKKRQFTLHMILLVSVLLFFGFFASRMYAQTEGIDYCVKCHKEEVGGEPVQVYDQDIHKKWGVSCSDCHGGDPNVDDMDAAMSAEKGYIGVPKGDVVVDVCLRCHANEEIMKTFGSSINVEPFKVFRESVHGKSDITTCVTCHGVHKIQSPKNPLSPVYPINEVKTCSKCHTDAEYMKKYNPRLATDQYAKYITSMHGRKLEKGDTRVATCSDCHGAHDIFPPDDPRSHVYAVNVPQTCARCHANEDYMRGYRIPTDQFEKYKNSVHGIALLKKLDTGAPACNDCHGNHGAMPPGVQSVSFVCGTCHALNAEYFQKSKHFKAFQENDVGQCEACHGNHGIQHPTDELLNVKSDKSPCVDCHTEEDKGYKTALEYYTMFVGLQKKLKEAEAQLKRAEEAGMDVEEGFFELNNLQKIYIQAQTLTHTGSLDLVKEKVNEAIQGAQKAYQIGVRAIQEMKFRRRGLGIATLFITLLVLSLYLKIRQIEKAQRD